jgi:hypothetical protein
MGLDWVIFTRREKDTFIPPRPPVEFPLKKTLFFGMPIAFPKA